MSDDPTTTSASTSATGPATAARPRLRRSWLQRSVIALNLVLIAVSVGAAGLLHYAHGRAASINRVALGRSLTAVPDDLEPGERVMNILLVGTDSSANLDEDDPIQIGRQGERFGDVIIIAHIDERSGDVALLSLPRDLWVDIGDTGRPGKINRAFVAGGPASLIETIENEFDLPINYYVNVDFAGFQGLVAAVESVEVWFDSPARDWNANAKPEPRSQTGFIVEEAGCHALEPEMALAYVRSRYYQTQDVDGRWVTDPTSDLGRIRRQQDFLRRVMKRAIDLGARNPFVLKDLIDTGLENVAIDQRLTPQLLLDLGTTFRDFDPDGLQAYSFPAYDDRVGSEYVLQPRTEDAETVLELFRGAGFDDPATIEVAVFVPPDLDDGRKAISAVGAGAADDVGVLAALRSAGFRIEPTVDAEQTAPVAGLLVRHGPDGRHAAEVVAATLGVPAAYEEVGRLVGRQIEVVVGSAEPPSVEDPAPTTGDEVDDGVDGSVAAPADPSGTEDLGESTQATELALGPEACG